MHKIIYVALGINKFSDVDSWLCNVYKKARGNKRFYPKLFVNKTLAIITRWLQTRLTVETGRISILPL